MRLARIAKVAKWVGIVVALLVVALTLFLWLSYPKRASDGVTVRVAGPGVFKFTDIPRGRELSPAEVEQYVDRLMAEMTLEEKVHQMSGDSWLWELIKLITIEDFKYNDRPIPSGHNRRLAIPPITFADGPRGVVLNHSTAFPVAIARGATWDTALQARFGDVVAREARAQGANFYGGVCINLLRHPSWGRAQETLGEDPYLLGELAAALIPAVQRHNVMACAKHFALNSIEEVRTTVDVTIEERALREVYLPHFQRAVDSGVASVMSAYNRVRGDYCGENAYLLRKVLKEDWGFRGFVMSDFFNGLYDGPKAARAGLDIEMPLARRFNRGFIAAVERGEVPRAAIDEAVRRILRRKIEYATRPDRQQYDASLVVHPDHVRLAQEVAEKSMVLLKNEGALLPLDKGRVKTLAVLGRYSDVVNIGDYGSSRVYPPRATTPLQGLTAHLGAGARVVHDKGADLAKARQLARQADAVVIVVGFDHSDEGEYIPEKPDKTQHGGDREDLALKVGDRELILAAVAENPRTIVALLSGTAVTMEEWRAKVPAILLMWYPGMEGGTALARILFGDVNPSGRLPITFPKDASQLPPFDSHAKTIEYGYFHGYTLADKSGFEPAFPFGFGLSYTTFRYANLRLGAQELAPDGAVDVSVDVTNSGTRPGAEVVQLYVGCPGSAVERPVKVLRGFVKVELAAGETKTVTLPLRARDLAFYDTATSAWRVEPLRYNVSAGSSSRASDLLTAKVRVATPPQSGSRGQR